MLLKKALSILPGNAVREIRDHDIEEYEVVRVADEVKIPFASAELMHETKQSLRDKDEIDRVYLKRILEKL